MKIVTNDNFMHYLFFLRTKIICFLSSLYMNVICRCWNVKIGSDCKFYGTMLVYRHPESKIEIGRKCRFRSSKSSNFAGLNRSCSISTTHIGARISIGDNCGISSTVICCEEEIIIGNNIFLGANSTIVDTDFHPLDPYERIIGEKGLSSKIHINDNVWVGMNSTILKGVTIGKNSVIAANSLVSSDVPDNCVVAGIPAKIIKNIDVSKQL